MTAFSCRTRLLCLNPSCREVDRGRLLAATAGIQLVPRCARPIEAVFSSCISSKYWICLSNERLQVFSRFQVTVRVCEG